MSSAGTGGTIGTGGLAAMCTDAFCRAEGTIGCSSYCFTARVDCGDLPCEASCEASGFCRARCREAEHCDPVADAECPTVCEVDSCVSECGGEGANCLMVSDRGSAEFASSGATCTALVSGDDAWVNCYSDVCDLTCADETACILECFPANDCRFNCSNPLDCGGNLTFACNGPCW